MFISRVNRTRQDYWVFLDQNARAQVVESESTESSSSSGGCELIYCVGLDGDDAEGEYHYEGMYAGKKYYTYVRPEFLETYYLFWNPSFDRWCINNSILENPQYIGLNTSLCPDNNGGYWSNDTYKGEAEAGECNGD